MSAGGLGAAPGLDGQAWGAGCAAPNVRSRDRTCQPACCARCACFACCAADEALERDMFGLVWGPTLAAVSVVLDGAGDPGVAQRALDCLLLAARMAAYHQVGCLGSCWCGCCVAWGAWSLC